MIDSPPLLVDTSSLLRCEFDLKRSGSIADPHAATVLACLILFEDVVLDGPSVDFEGPDLVSIGHLVALDDSVQLIDINRHEQMALYDAGKPLLEHVLFDSHDLRPIPLQMSELFVGRLDPGASRSVPLEYIVGVIDSPELWHMYSRLRNRTGTARPYSDDLDSTFVILARLGYYLALQQSTASSLLLDPTKGVDNKIGSARRMETILDRFDATVGEAYRKQKREWLGLDTTSFRVPILTRYLREETTRRGWSYGQLIAEMRHSRDVHAFRDGIAELQSSLDAGNVKEVSKTLSALDSAVDRWTRQLGAKEDRRTNATITVGPPFMSVGSPVSLPRFRRRSTAKKLLVFVERVLGSA